jgi:hypothetical protein
MAIIRHLFELLRQGDRFVRHLLIRWATGVFAEDAEEDTCL